MKLKVTFAAIAMAFAASTAHAGFQPVDDLNFVDDSQITALTMTSDIDGTLSFDYNGFVASSFEQFFSFTLPAAFVYDTSAHASNYKLSSTKNAKDITVLEFEVYDTDGNLLLDTSASSPVGTIGSDFIGTLTAGKYYIEIEGSALATGGKVGINVLASPTAVPEPSAWAMMVAGLGMLGYMSIRRRNYF